VLTITLASRLFKQGMVGRSNCPFCNALQLIRLCGSAFNLGNVFLHTGKPDEAIACFQDALHIRPDYAEAHYIWASFFPKRKSGQAIDHYQRRCKSTRHSWMPAITSHRLFKEASGPSDHAVPTIAANRA